MKELTHEENLKTHEATVDKRVSLVVDNEYSEILQREAERGITLNKDYASFLPPRMRPQTFEGYWAVEADSNARRAEEKATKLLFSLASLPSQPIREVWGGSGAVDESVKYLRRELEAVFQSALMLWITVGELEVPIGGAREAQRKLVKLFDERGKMYGSAYQSSPFPFIGLTAVLRYRTSRLVNEFLEGVVVGDKQRESNILDVMNYAIMALNELKRQFETYDVFARAFSEVWRDK